MLPGAALAAVPGLGGAGYLICLLVLCVAALDAAFSLRRLDGIRVSAPEVIRMWKNRAGPVDLSIHNNSKRAQSLRLGLALPDEIPAKDEEVAIRLNAGPGQVLLPWPCTPWKRGRYQLQMCALETASALGLWSLRRRLPLQSEIRVYPDVASTQKSMAFLNRGMTGPNPQRHIGRGREFEKLRDYAAGDGFDEVDWKATARRGRPITRVFQVEKTQEVYVVLDASRLLARHVSEERTDTILERNISAALLLAVQAQNQGDLFGLVTFSDRVHGFVRARNGKAHYGACRETLYTLQARTVAPDFDEVCRLLRLRLRRRALLIFLTELDDPVIAESFLKNVSLLRRQHLVIAGMLRPAAARPVFEGDAVSELNDIYERLAGQQQWTKLRELTRILDREGIRLSLFEPSTLAAEFTSAYMTVKQRQLL